MLVRDRTPADEREVAAFLAANHSVVVARLGALCTPLEHPGLVAVAPDGALLGVLTYVLDGVSCEILTLHAVTRGRGAGTALIGAVRERAARAGCTRLWLVTTNDNVDALRFYQRRGFALTALHPGAVTASRRTLKPEIPEIGDHGIPLRDELVLATPVTRRVAHTCVPTPTRLD